MVRGDAGVQVRFGGCSPAWVSERRMILLLKHTTLGIAKIISFWPAVTLLYYKQHSTSFFSPEKKERQRFPADCPCFIHIERTSSLNWNNKYKEWWEIL